MERQEQLAVQSIEKNPHNPTDRLWHKEKSTRVQDAEQRKREQDANMMANLAEFERLDNRRDLLSDDEYFRWVFLHPEWNAETKQRFTNRQKKDINQEK